MATETIALRDELKSWENTFRLNNNGRKPSREEIKSNADIAAKYKRFNSLRCPEPAKQTHSTPKKTSRRPDVPDNALRERAPNAGAVTPRRKASKPIDNPQEPVLSPVREEQPTPAFIRNGLGPTPQRDGHVLGIFDMLPNATPSKQSPPSPSGEHGDAVHATPSKSSTRPTDSALSRTPQSSSKRYFLDSFITTPGKRKREDDEVGTPSSSKKLYATPSFLRRVSAPMAPIDEEDAMPPPRRMKPLSRSFSAIIQGLRDQEEERMDDEWDVMNELEAEERGEAPPKKKQAEPEPAVVTDSQLVVMPLGPDRAPEESESEEEVALGANGLPRKVPKKKGQKRTTRKSNIKPVLNKPKKAADLDNKETDDDDDEEVVAETQLQDSEDIPAAITQPDRATDKPVGTVRRVAQKVSQNMRRLNIKGQNPKSKGKGRFGRR